jgi:hypothetical protein
MLIYGGLLPPERSHSPWLSTCQANLSDKYRFCQYWFGQYIALA